MFWVNENERVTGYSTVEKIPTNEGNVDKDLQDNVPYWEYPFFAMGTLMVLPINYSH